MPSSSMYDRTEILLTHSAAFFDRVLFEVFSVHGAGKGYFIISRTHISCAIIHPLGLFPSPGEFEEQYLVVSCNKTWQPT